MTYIFFDEYTKLAVHQAKWINILTCFRDFCKKKVKASICSHIWYLNHLLASSLSQSISTRSPGEAVIPLDCIGPGPDSAETIDIGQPSVTQDILYLFLWLTCDHITRMEQLCDPCSHTSDRMDVRMTWFDFRVLEILSYIYVPGRTAPGRGGESGGAGRFWAWSVFIR